MLLNVPIGNIFFVLFVNTFYNLVQFYFIDTGYHLNAPFLSEFIFVDLITIYVRISDSKIRCSHYFVIPW